ncbi:hypothetical protein LTR56_006132 [Elasticomyces elasticus]|uniref:Small ribosomal subunit protein bS6m n=1 Tax=Elasticomyces elasticus TaxID=574655 RepID=A0AAN7W361_9PEZI|nr:hypothetical protein LTR56_016912 [Elasticomyces elasticus]KAK3650727.1 hypothetical protein LTR56_006132 [Elasticomyces elasticus]KAK3658682.1 hypothetical protein LTR22_008854 [Elasticomyces elasticus]KAK3667606.1 hypothetical protein LTR22_001421 [Elasticomyces elasticus]KAK4899414.1 hypothetical protein LTR27_003147 [Elasticomyces elasticus]
MLYELIGVVRPGRGINEIKEIAKTTGNIILSRGGVIRGITNWGTFLLPKPARKQGAIYDQGHYFILRFDSGAQTQHAVRRTLGLDPRMIRYSVVKMGSKLEEIADVAGKAEWENDRAPVR